MAGQNGKREAAEHTPGPWEAHATRQGGWIVLTSENRADLLASFGFEDEPDFPRRMADAQLAAAAPDLLALVLAVEWVPDPSDMGDPDYCPWCHETKPNHGATCERQAAIARAKRE